MQFLREDAEKSRQVAEKSIQGVDVMSVATQTLNAVSALFKLVYMFFFIAIGGDQKPVQCFRLKYEYSNSVWAITDPNR